MKNSNNIIKRFLGCMLCSAVLTLTGASAAQADTAQRPLSEPVCIFGTIQKDNGRLSMTNIQGDTTLDELILNTSETTRILDAVNGFPVSIDNIREGELVYAYISPAMTLSLPPQSHAEMIICGIPADFSVPSYETAENLVVGENGAAVVSTAGGSVYYIDAASVLLPHLTRNIVTVHDLTKGRKFLVWKTPIGQTGEHAAARIVMFAN